MDGYADFVLTHTLFQLGLYRLQVQVQAMEEIHHGSVLAAQHPQEQVLRSYAAAGQSRCLFT
jgi:hypothetical protein